MSKPPYEVNETGWGEFEIQIKVYFMDPIERPVRIRDLNSLICNCSNKNLMDNNWIFSSKVTLYHLLKLFQTEAALASGKKNLVSEYYDEIVS